MEGILFVLLSVMALGGGLWVLLRRSPVDSVLGLLTTMVAIAGHYMLLDAPFLAAVQLIVYGGAVVILFMFVIMLLNLREDRPSARRLAPGRWVYALAGGIVLLSLAGVFQGGGAPGSLAAGESGTVEAFGEALFRRWVYPFELTSVLLLAALVGAVALTRQGQAASKAEDKA